MRLTGHKTFTVYEDYNTIVEGDVAASLASTEGVNSPRSAAPRRTIVPVLHARDVRHAPALAVPATEALHAERPESGRHVGHDDQAVGIANIDAERAIAHLAALGGRRAKEGVVVSHRRRVLGVHEGEYLQAVEVAGDEYERPTNLVVVHQEVPVGGPG